MRKTIISTLVALTSSAAIAIPFDSIEPIDSSNWDVNPANFGMTAEQFLEAESLHFMANMVKREGINGIFHFTTLAKAEDRWVVSPNNDVVYSMAVVDASEGFTLSMPDTGDRYITAQIVSQEHMSTQLLGGGEYTFDGSEFKGSHVAIGFRVGTDGSAEDVEHIVKSIQPKMSIKSNSAKPVPSYDVETLLVVRGELMKGYNVLPDTFGQMTDDVRNVQDWQKFTYSTAGAWGLSADEYAMYAPYNPGVSKDVCHVATYPQPEVEHFWSITLYNNEKYLMSNEYNVINTGNVNLNQDGTFTVHFGSKEACAGVKDIKNFALITEDNWGFLMRAYGANVEQFKSYQMPKVAAAK
ncbi:hypothetical protein VIN01S_22890 [Vibrio inusitatus NBRC 102082]|uniref:Murein transglycosylase n=1 Tax=Vibrio inusitatus NBRC 102082 TaxID=1219070 RepID=A0A4Y3HWT5_9VIBR|nr:DUF1254 domain-containing protein [Vibrio inusitatus]GEA51485.1 hypothetical protein VIN01S_22890 [Vibrio inusitatus NBRC 102082]